MTDPAEFSVPFLLLVFGLCLLSFWLGQLWQRSRQRSRQRRDYFLSEIPATNGYVCCEGVPVDYTHIRTLKKGEIPIYFRDYGSPEGAETLCGLKVSWDIEGEHGEDELDCGCVTCHDEYLYRAKGIEYDY